MTSYGVKLTWGSLWGTYTMSTALFHRPKVWDGGVADFWCPYAVPHLHSQGTDEKILTSLPLFRWGARKLVGEGGLKDLKPKIRFLRENEKRLMSNVCLLCFWTKFGYPFSDLSFDNHLHGCASSSHFHSLKVASMYSHQALDFASACQGSDTGHSCGSMCMVSKWS